MKGVCQNCKQEVNEALKTSIYLQSNSFYTTMKIKGPSWMQLKLLPNQRQVTAQVTMKVTEFSWPVPNSLFVVIIVELSAITLLYYSFLFFFDFLDDYFFFCIGSDIRSFFGKYRSNKSLYWPIV